MIISYANGKTEDLAAGRVGDNPVEKKAVRKIRMIESATSIDDLRSPPGNRLHALKGKMKGRWAIWVNNQYRITFRFENGNAHDVKFEDYH